MKTLFWAVLAVAIAAAQHTSVQFYRERSHVSVYVYWDCEPITAFEF